MISRLKSLTLLTALLMFGIAGRGFSLHSDPKRIEVGDTGSISVTFGNMEGGVSTIEGVHLVVVSAPLWIDIDTAASYTGPANIYPGEQIVFNADYVINETFNSGSAAGSIILNLLSDSTSFVPSGITWTFTTDNGFKTMSGFCVANDGVMCGSYISPDGLSPNTHLWFNGPSYEPSAGPIIVATHTGINFIGSDAYESNAVISRAAMTGYSRDVLPASFDILNFSTSAVLFTEGQHFLYFASRDYAGNTEVIKSTVVVVDGSAPSPLTGIAVDGVAPGGWNNTGAFNISWTDPGDVSGVAGVRVKYGDVAPISNSDGDFYPASGSLLYSSTQIVAGVNVVWLWPEDNVGNADPVMAVSVELRYDGGLPGSAVSAPAYSGTRLVPVGFSASDAASGVRETALWRRLGGAAWSSGTYVLSGNGGTFSFDTANAEGTWQFYTQACDNAGNCEPTPVSTTTAKAQTIVDVTPPVISNVRVTEITYDSARVSWETDDEASGVAEYTLPGAAAAKTYASSYYNSQSLLLSGLVYPANYTFNIAATNKAGLSAVYTGGAFYVPPRMTTNVNDMGVLNIGQPIVIQVTNPYVSSITYTLNGQTVTQAVTPNQPVEIYATGAQGQTSLSLDLGGFTYAAEFVVDTATRTVYLARLAITDGGLDAAQGGWAAQAAVGQAVAGDAANVGGKAYLGYYAGIDPVAPGPVTNLSAVAGSGDQASLSWTAPGVA